MREECGSAASSFIWLFDEPGIYLHPEGQHDLLQVLETLSRSNQIIYGTHSIFLLNKNYPARHRLLKKDERGTVVDEKPYTARWGAAIDALGLALPGTILFASKILLVEGDSDPILLGADLQKLIELGRIEFDVNELSIIGTSTSQHADAFVRLFTESSISPAVSLLFDGDDGGRDRHRRLKSLIESRGLSAEFLSAGTTIEDHVLSPESYREAAIIYVQKVLDNPDRNADVANHMTDAYVSRVGSGSPKGMAQWACEEGARYLGGPPSSVGIAREYAALIAGRDRDAFSGSSSRRAIALAERIRKMLDLAAQTLQPAQILED